MILKYFRIVVNLYFRISGILNIKMRRAVQGDSQGVRNLFMQSEDDDHDELKSRIDCLHSVHIMIKDE